MKVAAHFKVVPGTIYNYFKFDRDRKGNVYVAYKKPQK